MVGSFPACCALAASGHEAAPPISVRTSRRLIDRSAIRSEPWSGLQDIGLAEISQPIDRLFPEASQEPILRWFFALFADKRRVGHLSPFRRREPRLALGDPAQAA
jgi:hypothetical protein